MGQTPTALTWSVSNVEDHLLTQITKKIAVKLPILDRMFSVKSTEPVHISIYSR